MKKRLLSLFIAFCLATNILPIIGAGEAADSETTAESAVVFNKSIIPATDNSPAKIRLEAYVNGAISTSERLKPADIVLVLDQSGSMSERVGWNTKLSLLKTAASNFVNEVAAMNNAEGNRYRVAIVGFASEGSNTEILTLNNGRGKSQDDLTNQDYLNSLVNCTTSATGDDGILTEAISNLTANGATRADLGMEMATNVFGNQPAGTYDERAKIVIFITDGEPTTYSSFSATVANAAVAEAKELKDDGAHIFSLYIGTPSANSQNFLQAVSSNYPNATTYQNRGTKVDSTYYSAHSAGADIENMLTTVANTISALSTLNETSIITGTISEHFMLAADVETTALDQIEVYTVDMTANGWSNVEVPYDQAEVSFIGEGKKTIGVTGFNFASNCVTETPRNGSFYGRKIVIYIPIVEDENSDIFGGWVPASVNAAIYQNEEALKKGEETVTAGAVHADAKLSYVVSSAERAFHVDGTLLTDEASFTVSFTGENGIVPSVFDEMIPEIPDYFRNIGVDITYKLLDIGTTDVDDNDRNDDVLIATLTVNAADGVDITDPSKWEWTAGYESTTLTIPANEYFTEKVFVVVATLTSIRDVNNPETLTVYNYLDLSVVRGELAHIVSGIIDSNGKTTVPSTAPGHLVGNAYTEAVTENQDSAIMTFTPNEGYRIKEIIIRTSENAPFDKRNLVYSTVSGATVVQIDLDGDGVNDEIVIASDGSWSFGAKNVTSGISVEISTEPITKVLTTSSDKGSEIIVGRTYNYSTTEKINVPFRALNGFRLATVNVNGTVYDLTSESDVQELIDLYSASFTYGTDADGKIVIIGGDVFLPATQDNDVKITSARREFSVFVKYYIENEDGSITEFTDISKDPVILEFGTVILDEITFDHVEGDVAVIKGVKYILNGWYFSHIGNGFSEIIEETDIMPASDLTLNAVWVKVPTYTVSGTVDENGKLTVPNVEVSGNTYTETVTENDDSAVMTFIPNVGHNIEEIYITVAGNESLVHSTVSGATVVQIDLDGDGVNDEIVIASDGSWSFGAKSVVADVEVEVYTKPVSKTLTTSSDNGSNITDGYSYEYSTTETVDVSFGTEKGYILNSIEINGILYDLTSKTDVEELEKAFDTDLILDGDVVVGGEIKLSATTDNDVKVTSELCEYNLQIMYYVRNEDDTYTYISSESTQIEHGANVLDALNYQIEAGDVFAIGGVNYVFEGLYRSYEGDGFTVPVDGTETMPADDLILNGVLTVVPTPPTGGGEQINPDTADGTVTTLFIGLAAVAGILVLKSKKRIEDEE